MVFDLVDLQTLLRLDWWYERLGDYYHADSPRIFIGTKNDLVKIADEKSKVDDLVIKRFMERHDEGLFFRTSSRDNYNVQKIFKELVIKVLEKNKLDYDKLL